MDNLDDLLADLYWLDSGWSRVVNPANGNFAVFPETAKSEDDWERRSIEMHAAQTPIHLEAKPVENTMRRIVRGD